MKKRDKTEGSSVYINRETGRTRNRFFWRKGDVYENTYGRAYRVRNAQELAANEMPIEEQIIIAAEKQRLKKAIQKLSEKEQWILSMRFDEELTYKQIAQQIGVKPQNIGGILERIYKHLRRILEEVELN